MGGERRGGRWEGRGSEKGGEGRGGKWVGEDSLLCYALSLLMHVCKYTVMNNCINTYYVCILILHI